MPFSSQTLRGAKNCESQVLRRFGRIARTANRFARPASNPRCESPGHLSCGKVRRHAGNKVSPDIADAHPRPLPERDRKTHRTCNSARCFCTYGAQGKERITARCFIYDARILQAGPESPRNHNSFLRLRNPRAWKPETPGCINRHPPFRPPNPPPRSLSTFPSLYEICMGKFWGAG